MIDVIIPTHNSAKTVLETLASILQFSELNPIFIDDHSTDDTLLSLEVNGYSPHKLESFGAYNARIHGVLHSKSKYVIFLDSDDLLESGWQEGFRMLEDNCNLVGVGGNVTNFGLKRLSTTSIKPCIEDTASLLNRGFGPWPISGSIWRRVSLEESISIDIPCLKPPFAEDFEMMVRASIVGDISSIDEVMCQYRVTSGKSQRDPYKSLTSALHITRHYKQALGFDEQSSIDSEFELLVSRRRVQISLYETGTLKTAFNALTEFSKMIDALNVAKLIYREKSLRNILKKDKNE
jgi:hypothetical protein